jgi:hypothetical protein
VLSAELRKRRKCLSGGVKRKNVIFFCPRISRLHPLLFTFFPVNYLATLNEQQFLVVYLKRLLPQGVYSGAQHCSLAKIKMTPPFLTDLLEMSVGTGAKAVLISLTHRNFLFKNSDRPKFLNIFIN